MSKVDDFYEEAMKDWAARSQSYGKVIGFRDDITDIEAWKTYCLTFKPIPYAEYLRWIVRAWNREVPPPPGWPIASRAA